ncbi:MULTISPECIES: c-type cytochrome [Chryseobacterium]
MIPEPQVAAPAETAAKTEAATSEADGEKLLAGMDCLSCHKVDAKLVGPSYQDVAAKYSEADLDMLAQKVIEGGKGNWGEIPMAPHAGLSKDNAQKMVRYILSLKK